MLNFKVGKIYKSNDGKEWRYCGYINERRYPYYFKCITNGLFFLFAENSNNSVVSEGDGIKILFVEEKERDWVVGEEYECIDLNCQRILTAKLTEVDDGDSVAKYRFKVDGAYRWFSHLGEIIISSPFILFKSGIPQELKDRLNKSKFTNKQKCFQKEQIYKSEKGFEWKFKKRIKTEKGLVALFEDETSDVFSFSLYRLNNIECILTSHDTVAFCADESIRNGDGSKAVRVKE